MAENSAIRALPTVLLLKTWMVMCVLLVLSWILLLIIVHYLHAAMLPLLVTLTIHAVWILCRGEEVWRSGGWRRICIEI